MIDAIKGFQKDNGLKVDGIMKPGGPTENTLGAVIGGFKLPEPKKPEFPKDPEFPKIPNPPYEGIPTPVDPVQSKPFAFGQIVEENSNPLEGNTVQQRLQSLMRDARYGDKKEDAFRNHVVQQFEKAYPGNVKYDETG